MIGDALRSFLLPFPAAVTAAVEGAVAAGASVVLPEPSLSDFRRAPLGHLGKISETLRELWRTSTSSRVVWCVVGSRSAGLDAFEVPAILGRYLHLDRVHQQDGEADKRIIAVGTLREEHVALAASLPGTADPGRWLAAVTAARVPAIVLLTSDQAANLGQTAEGMDTAARFLSLGGSFGLCVPAERTAEALGDGLAETASMRRLLSRAPAIVRFDVVPGNPDALNRFMTETGIECDVSIAIDSGAAAQGAIVRPAAYAGASPYRPQPFDLRTPWFQTEPRMWFELPAVPTAADAVASWWAARFEPRDEQLAPLLDATRMEAFYRASRIDPAEEARYPEFRIYNWPAPPPAVRVSLLYADECTAAALLEIAAACSSTVAEAGPRAHLATGVDLLALGRAEVEARYGLSATRAIDAQNEAHGYLSTVPHEAALRPDYADFARFVAPELGVTLELGSGFGVLAWALSLRASRYVCVDLDRRMFGALRKDLHQAGLVADMHRLPFADAIFDSVVANNVLEHLYDPLTGLREIRRILKPGGRVFALVPLDALNSRHALPAHLWKLDEPAIRAGFEAAGYAVARIEVVHLNEVGVAGAFPTCHGLAAKVEAVNGEAPVALTSRAGRAPALRGLPGRMLPMVREVAGFERWRGRRVLTIDSEPTDIDEFRHFGAQVEEVAIERSRLQASDASGDLAYGFLTLPAATLPAVAADLHRVVAPGGAVVAGFRNRAGLRYLARVRSYFGAACDIDAMFGADTAAALAEDDGATADHDYTTAEEVRRAFAPFSSVDITIRGLTPDDLPAAAVSNGDARFLQWLSQTLGRFILVKAVR